MTARNPALMTIDEAILHLRADPSTTGLMRDSYLDADVRAAIERFQGSVEWAEVRDILGSRLQGSTVVDLGSGIGMASAAFIRDGAARVIAVEPDPSELVGYGAMQRAGVPAEVVRAMGEDLPLPSGSIDIVYCRQVLHHAADLDRLVAEVARILRPGGVFLACREHVVSNDGELREFLEAHAVNRLAGGENAFPLHRYEGAIRKAGLRLQRTIGPRDSVITAFPAVRSKDELDGLLAQKLGVWLGPIGRLLSLAPLVPTVYRWTSRRRGPGRMFAFLAVKPEG